MQANRIFLSIIAFVIIILGGCGGGGGSNPQPQVVSTPKQVWEFQQWAGATPPVLQSWAQGVMFVFENHDGAHYLVTPTSNAAFIASITVDVAGTPVFDYKTEPTNTQGEPAGYGFYFERSGDMPLSTPDGKYEFYRWWYMKRVPLAAGSISMQADVNDLANWTSVFGKHADAYPEQFHEAINNMQYAGITFGGGSFYGHGVFVDAGTGSATFKLNSFQ